MNPRLRISVAMCTYNGERFLRQQLQSIAAQTRLPDEMVVCDDCSSDATPKIIEEFARGAQLWLAGEVCEPGPGLQQPPRSRTSAALRVKLKHLGEWNSLRANIAVRYTAALRDTGHILPAVPTWAEPIWHLYVVQRPQRDRLQKSLSDAGVATLIHYPIPPHLQQAYAGSRFAAGQFPIAERMANRLLSLPLGPQLQDADVDAVIAVLQDAARTFAANP